MNWRGVEGRSDSSAERFAIPRRREAHASQIGKAIEVGKTDFLHFDAEAILQPLRHDVAAAPLAAPSDRPAGRYSGRFSNRPVGVKRFQTIHRHGVWVTRGRVLLYGIGTKALPSWDPRTRWNYLSGGLAGGRSKRPSGLTSSIVPRGTPFHRWVELELPPIAIDAVRASCCRYGLSGPSELGAVNPDAVQDHGQPACQRDDRLLFPAAPGDLHRPSLEP